MSAIGAILTKKQINRAYATVTWGDDDALLVDILYAVLTPERQDRLSPFDPDKMKLPSNITTANSVQDIAALVPERTKVYSGYGLAEVIKENQELRRLCWQYKTGQTLRTIEPWEEK